MASAAAMVFAVYHIWKMLEDDDAQHGQHSTQLVGKNTLYCYAQVSEKPHLCSDALERQCAIREGFSA